jgi:uncharacterized protein YjbI with pentapeptide repeats
VSPNDRVPARERCDECRGARLGRRHCLAHLSASELDSVGRRLQSGEPLNARGVRITTERLAALLDRLRAEGGPPRLPAARFDGACFSGDAHFAGVQFSGEADFREAQFSGDADFRGAQFSRAHHLGPLTTTGNLILEGAVFLEHVTVVVRADRLLAADARFQSGADVLVQSAEIEFDRATFSATSTVSPATRHDAPDPLLANQYGQQSIPSVMSLRGARIVDLALSGIDLRACLFRGAHGLANLRLEQVLLAEPPDRWTKEGRWPFPVRWTRRVAIAEEHWWRAKWFGWDKPKRQGSSREDPPTPTPHQIAAIYRSLRKGQEERKDEPGAADFYYGEMEMRRHSEYKDDDRALSSDPPYMAPSLERWAEYDNTRRTPLPEKLVLWLYWLVSGYGLRASRALVALAITIAVGAILLGLFGFDEGEHPESGAVLFAVESSLSLLRAPETNPLTDGGEVVAIALRLLGPLFFGLALLSLRGRVRR